MALRNQPYLPLYVQDVLTDEKLMMCSPESHGVYFRLLCILHKQDVYGLLCLKQKYKQNENKIICFAQMLYRFMPFSVEQISSALEELVEERVIVLEGDNLIQKRMLKDGNLSLIRSETGKKGGSNVTKQYGKKGFIYFMSDTFEQNKIGISVNPKNRLYRLRSDLKLPKHFDIIKQVEVSDMGKTEDLAHVFFGSLMDGEWIKTSYENALKKFDLFIANLKANNKANNEANAEIENEGENESEIDFNEGGLGETKVDNSQFLNRALETHSWITTVAMQTKTSEDFVREKLNEFSLHLQNTFDQKKNQKDFSSHFVNWFNSKKSNPEFFKKEDEQKLGRMTITEAKKNFTNFANVTIPGQNE